MTERMTSGVIRLLNPVDDRRRGPRDRFGLRVAVDRLVERLVPLVATDQTSTTTGKTIGRRLVCSYR